MPVQANLFDLKFALRRFVGYRMAVSLSRAVVAAAKELLNAALRVATYPFKNWGLPLGSYSLLDQVRKKPEIGRVLLEGQGNPPASADSLMVRSGMRQHKEQPWPIFWARIKDARLIGESLALVNSDKKLCLESVFGKKRLKSDPAWSYFMAPEPSVLDGPWTSVISRWVPRTGPTNFAHWLTEVLPRLACLPDFPSETRILIPEPLQPFQVKTLEWLGVLDRCKPAPGASLRIADYYFSGPPCMIVCYSPYSVHFLREKFLGRAAMPDPPRRCFYLRRKGRYRGVVNENVLFEFFEKLGWAIVDTAAISLDEQIALFKNAEAIVAVHGAGLANLAWCSAGCKVLELCPSRYLNSAYEWMAMVVGAEYRYLLFPSDHALNCFVDLSSIKGVLSQWGML